MGLGRAGNLLSLLSVFLLSGCVSQGDGGPVEVVAIASERVGYQCEDGGRIEIENRGASIVLLRDGDDPLELPASPAESRNRYGASGIALLVEEGEALLMRAGEEPHTCRR